MPEVRERARVPSRRRVFRQTFVFMEHFPEVPAAPGRIRRYLVAPDPAAGGAGGYLDADTKGRADGAATISC